MTRLRLILGALLLTSALAGCGSDSEGSSTPEGPVSGAAGEKPKDPAEPPKVGDIKLAAITAKDFCAKLDQAALTKTLDVPTDPFEYSGNTGTCIAAATDRGYMGGISVTFEEGKEVQTVRDEIAKVKRPDLVVENIPGLSPAEGLVSNAFGTIVVIGLADGYLQCGLGYTEDKKVRTAHAKLCLEQVYRLAG